jgi:hypothetical protein
MHCLSYMWAVQINISQSIFSWRRGTFSVTSWMHALMLVGRVCLKIHGCSSFKKSTISLNCRGFERDLGLHELIFEEDVLPDRTKVSYYSRGQVYIPIRWTSQLFYLINWICFSKYWYVVSRNCWSLTKRDMESFALAATAR